jgi:hypothetical protein
LTLQVIRQVLSDERALLNELEAQDFLSRIDTKVQAIVDLICDHVPFHLGDTMTPTNPIYSASLNFPYTLQSDPPTGQVTRIPSAASDYQKRAAAAGGWVIFPDLVNILRMAEPKDDAVPIVLRDGQLDWIKGQIARLQRIFLFCDPVWFRRQ